jgi:hypothetical protein
MARARRAKPRRSRALIALIVVALLAGGVVAALRFWPGSLVAISPTSGTSTTPSQASPSAPATASSASPSPSASGGATAASAEAVRTLEACQTRVRAADDVLKQARTGIGHWETHIDAQRRWDDGDISLEERQAQFKASRLKGPADQKRYSDAVRAYDDHRDADCGEVEDADAEIAATLDRCSERSKAQTPVMSAAAEAMGDWKQHLADMQRAKEVHVANAQEIWLAMYRNAPTNINAYNKAIRDFDAPPC